MKSQCLTFIAEIGMNHNGNFGLFFELIKQASFAGADYAKFQLGWRCGKGEINQLGPDELTSIKNCCEYHEIKPLFSIITEEAWDLAKNYNFDAFKIASRTVVDNRSLANEIIATGKPTFVSLGMTNEDTPLGKKDNIKYLWCKSEYPALPWKLKEMPKNFSKLGQEGYSDHSVGIEVRARQAKRLFD